MEKAKITAAVMSGSGGLSRVQGAGKTDSNKVKPEKMLYEGIIRRTQRRLKIWSSIFDQCSCLELLNQSID